VKVKSAKKDFYQDLYNDEEAKKKRMNLLRESV